jgi:ubiquinone/menaquinone biosynthesis C-methylase UbiE
MTLQKDPEGLEKKTLHKFVDFTNKHVLEVGCGEGRLTWQYAAAPRLTLGFDPDRDVVRVAQAKTPYNQHRHVHFVQASANHIPVSKGTFDIAILAWSL